MIKEFEVGKAPWELEETPVDTKSTGTPKEFEVGKAPWELEETPVDILPKEDTKLKDISSMSLVGALAGTEQAESPFVSSKPKEEPIMDLTAQRFQEGTKTVDERNAILAGNIEQDVQNMYSRYSTMGNQLLGYVDKDARDKAEYAISAERGKVLNEFKARGIEARYTDDGELIIKDTNGNDVVADSSILYGLYKSKWEIAGAVAGGATGANIGRIGGAPGMFIGGAIGSAVGATAGSGLDALATNVDLLNKASDDVIYDKMMDAGIADLVLGPIGYGTAKVAVGTGRMVKRTFDLVFDNNLDGAYRHLLDHFGVDETQAKEIVTRVEDLVGPLRGTDKEKAIQALTQTYRGGEGIVQAANVFDSKASANMANQVFKRAEDLLTQSKNLSSDNIQTIVKQNMDTYTSEVKKYYSDVKNSSSEFTRDYTFDFDSLGIQPIIEDIGARIENPAIKQRFVNTMTKIEQASEGRTFNDLIDLRQAVNDIKYNGPTLKYSDEQTLNKVLSTIDNEINTAAKTHIPESDTWLKSWDNAKTEYARMKDLESNVMYKALTRPGINEDQVVKTFTKYIGAGDNTFYQVMEKLPKNVQNRVEGAVLNNLVEKYTAGTVGEHRAVHFPLLSQELKKANWSSPKAKQLNRTIHRMAEVFQNDVNLARVSGRIEIPKFQSYLTTDPVVRMKYEIASTVFNHVKQYMPNDEANALALVKITGNLLENPLTDKGITELKRALPKDRRHFRGSLDFSPQLQELRQAYLERQMALKQMFNKDIPPRLVWKSNPDDLAKLQNPEATILPNIDDVLYATPRGTVSTNPSEAVLSDRASDFITEHIWRNTVSPQKDITEQALKYIDDKRFTSIMEQTASKLSQEDFEYNAKVVANSIKAEANILINRIEKDFGIKMPNSEAEKIIGLKFKEIMEACNGK